MHKCKHDWLLDNAQALGMGKLPAFKGNLGRMADVEQGPVTCALEE